MVAEAVVREKNPKTRQFCAGYLAQVGCPVVSQPAPAYVTAALAILTCLSWRAMSAPRVSASSL
jgi:hypothetical protein